MNISYKSWNMYNTCPKRYCLQYIKKAPYTEKEDRSNTVYGVLCQKFFELFCMVWRSQTPYMPEYYIKTKLQQIYPDVLRSCGDIKIDRDEVFEQAFKDIAVIMGSQNQNYFLNTTSEVTLKLKLQDNVTLEGRLDFVHFAPVSNEVTIFDGKGSKEISKYVDMDQLFFYSLLYFFQYQVVPEQIGFFYYRFNQFSQVLIDKSVLNDFRARLSLDIKKMVVPEQEYPAKPSSKTCRFCLYKKDCTEYYKDKLTRVKPSTLDLSGEGMTVFGF